MDWNASSSSRVEYCLLVKSLFPGRDAKYNNFQSLFRYSSLRTIAAYATDPYQKEKLLYFASRPGKSDFTSKQYSTLELLEAFQSIVIPFDHFIDLTPKLQPRFYTISSSSLVNPTAVHITVSLSINTKPNGRLHFGVCSSFLKACRPGNNLWVFFRPSSFRLPNSEVPIVMVGPGTGVAPFRAFVQEVAHIRAQKTQQKEAQKDEKQNHPGHKKDDQMDWNSLAVGPLWLFYGCRDRIKDFIYEDELKKAHTAAVLDQLILAFSREQKEKVYVQDKLKEVEGKIWDIIDKKNGVFYLCGAAAMGRSVRERLCKIAETKGGLTPEQSEAYFKRLLTDGRYIAELWS